MSSTYPRSDAGSEGVHRSIVRLGEAVQVLLGGHDAAVAETLLDDLDVPASGEQPGSVRVP
jgi:hypothetical protein